MTMAFLVVLVELAVITWIRHRYMETPIMSAATRWRWVEPWSLGLECWLAVL